MPHVPFLHWLTESSKTVELASILGLGSLEALELNSSCKIHRISGPGSDPALFARKHRDTGSKSFSTWQRSPVVRSIAAMFELGVLL